MSAGRTERSPVLSFEVAGEPQPQGSKVGLIVGHRIRLKNGPLAGKTAVVNPGVTLVEQADMKGKAKENPRPAHRLKDWRTSVADAATRAVCAQWEIGQEPLDCAVQLYCEFVFARPASHWTTKGALSAAGRRATHPGKPDLSKIVRAVEDALSGIAYDDDKRVVDYGGTHKRYADTRAAVGGVRVELRTI